MSGNWPGFGLTEIDCRPRGSNLPGWIAHPHPHLLPDH